MSLITLAELNTLTNTNLSSDHSVPYLESIMDIVSDHVTSYCLGTLFELSSMTDELADLAYVDGRTAKLTVKLNYAPLVSVGEVKYRIGSETTTMSLTQLELDQVHGSYVMLWYGPLYRVSQKWTILTSYMAGYETIPERAKMAVALLVLDWVDADDVAVTGTKGVLKSYRIGNYAESYTKEAGAGGSLGLGTTRSLRAAQILGPYRRPGVK